MSFLITVQLEKVLYALNAEQHSTSKTTIYILYSYVCIIYIIYIYIIYIIVFFVNCPIDSITQYSSFH